MQSLNCLSEKRQNIHARPARVSAQGLWICNLIIQGFSHFVVNSIIHVLPPAHVDLIRTAGAHFITTATIIDIDKGRDNPLEGLGGCSLDSGSLLQHWRDLVAKYMMPSTFYFLLFIIIPEERPPHTCGIPWLLHSFPVCLPPETYLSPPKIRHGGQDVEKLTREISYSWSTISSLISSSSGVRILRGLTQDSVPVSQYNFQYFESREWNSVGAATTIWVGRILYDLALISTYPKELQNMLNFCQSWSKETRLQINAEKSKVVVFYKTKPMRKQRKRPTKVKG